MDKFANKLLKNTMILSIGTICTKGIMFIMIPFFTRWLSQDDYGIFDLIITYITLFVPVVTLGCGEAVFRFLIDADEQKEREKIISTSLSISLISFIVSFIIATLIFFVKDIPLNLYLTTMVLATSETIYNFLTMILRGLKKLSNYTLANIIYVITSVIATILLVKVKSLGLIGILLGYSIGYIISSIYMIFSTKIKNYIKPKVVNKKLVKETLSYSMPLLPNSIAWWIMDASDRTIVTVILGAASNAILSVAHKVPNLCQTLYSVFQLSWQENASETISLDINEKTNYYNKVMNNMFCLLTSITIVILSANFILFEYIFTSDYYNGYYQVPILTVSIIFSMLSQFMGGIYIAQKETKKNGFTTTLAAVINLVLHILLIKYIGLFAATISTLISYISLFLIRYKDIEKTISLKFDKKSYKILAVLIYFVIFVYLNNYYINRFNLILAIIAFVLINKKYIEVLFKKFTSRITFRGAK